MDPDPDSDSGFGSTDLIESGSGSETLAVAYRGSSPYMFKVSVIYTHRIHTLGEEVGKGRSQGHG